MSGFLGNNEPDNYWKMDRVWFPWMKQGNGIIEVSVCIRGRDSDGGDPTSRCRSQIMTSQGPTPEVIRNTLERWMADKSSER